MSFLKKLSFFTLGYTLLVILWGAWVRISGSGAGCGSSWPLCDNKFIPSFSSKSLLIEWFHRLSSSFLICLIALLIYLSFKHFKPKSHLRKISLTIGFLVIIEALIGAFIVLFELTGSNTSVLRASVMSLHLLNTFFLIASMCAFIFFNKKSDFYFKMPKRSFLFFALILIFLSITSLGPLASLTNSLYPSFSFVEALKQDLSFYSSHWLLNLRWLHPLFAIFGVFFILITSFYLMFYFKKKFILFTTLIFFVCLQMFLGFMNLFSKAFSFKIFHLFIAYMIWIHLVLIFLNFFFKKKNN